MQRLFVIIQTKVDIAFYTPVREPHDVENVLHLIGIENGRLVLFVSTGHKKLQKVLFIFKACMTQFLVWSAPLLLKCPVPLCSVCVARLWTDHVTDVTSAHVTVQDFRPRLPLKPHPPNHNQRSPDQSTLCRCSLSSFSPFTHIHCRKSLLKPLQGWNSDFVSCFDSFYFFSETRAFSHTCF